MRSFRKKQLRTQRVAGRYGEGFISMEPEEKLVSAGIADGGRNDPSFDVIAAQNRISAPAAPRVDGGIEVHEQGGDEAPWEAILL